MRRLGRLRVLRALTDAGEVSRAELTRRTGLSRATVSSVIFDLVGEGLVREQAAPTAGPKLGRPPLTLSLVPSAGCVAGVDIGHDHARVILTDLVGTPILGPEPGRGCRYLGRVHARGDHESRRPGPARDG